MCDIPKNHHRLSYSLYKDFSHCQWVAVVEMLSQLKVTTSPWESVTDIAIPKHC